MSCFAVWEKEVKRSSELDFSPHGPSRFSDLFSWERAQSISAKHCLCTRTTQRNVVEIIISCQMLIIQCSF